MNRLIVNSLFITIILSIVIFISCIGCVTVEEVPLTEGLTKEKLIQRWGRNPDKISTRGNDLKYGADELWIYKYPGGSSQDRFYFKNGLPIKKEHVGYDVL